MNCLLLQTERGLIMKMITAIINYKDTNRVCQALAAKGFEHTRLATTGGFLRAGNTTVLMGVEDARLDEALEVIHQNCKRRKESVPEMPPADMPSGIYNQFPAEVMVGGAIVFVTEVQRFEKY